MFPKNLRLASIQFTSMLKNKHLMCQALSGAGESRMQDMQPVPGEDMTTLWVSVK